MGCEVLRWPRCPLPAPHPSLHLLGPQRGKDALQAEDPSLWTAAHEASHRTLPGAICQDNRVPKLGCAGESPADVFPFNSKARPLCRPPTPQCLQAGGGHGPRCPGQSLTAPWSAASATLCGVNTPWGWISPACWTQSREERLQCPNHYAAFSSCR